VIEIWPLISFLFVDPATRAVDEKAWRKVMKPGTEVILGKAAAVLAGADPYDVETLERELRGLVEAEGLSANKVLQPIRVAITGSTVSPGIFESLVALGRDDSIERIDRAIGRLRDGLPGDDDDPG
jgi:glutamyl-tRNA synthetase